MRPDATTLKHVIAVVQYALERIACSCGEVITAAPDPVRRDRHDPLVRAWEKHRREAGLAKGSGIRGTGWRGEWSMRDGSG